MVAQLQWTKDHKSTCGRFWCYKAPRSDMWQLFDKQVERNNRDYYHQFRYLSEAKAQAQYRITKGK